MKVHEYQAKEVLKQFGVAVPNGKLCATPDEAVTAARELKIPVVLKAQIHAGGRGKGGGIKVAKTESEAKTFATQMLGMKLVTPQTGAEGKIVQKIWVEQGCNIDRELYLGMVLDRSRSRLVLMASQEGGGEIEEVAARSPEKIFKVWIDPAVGLQAFQARGLALQLNLTGPLMKQFVTFATGLYCAFVSTDASLAEITPLVVTKEGTLLALDAKVNFDDNALYRHPDIAELRDKDEEDPKEREASEHNLNYISLDGNIACLVNGAGLATATMDIIKLHGGSPANFLDVGGGADQKAITEAFKIILRDPKTRAIFVNIFGGILKCDLLAEGIVAASRELHVKVPLVVRMLGTNVERGKAILKTSGLNIIAEDDFTLAAKKVVIAANEGSSS